MKGIIRKTILGIWFFGGLSACTSKPHFTIEGSLDEKVDGEAYIVGYPGCNKKPDTLARAEIRDGKFTLTGSLPDTMEAGLYITGEKTYAILLLENADYRAHLHLKNPEANRVEGPELQLLFAAYQAIGNKTEKAMTLSDALVIGLAQMIAVVPGLSRSGTTISAGMLRGFDRTFAVKFSFFLSIPAVLGANLLSLVKAISAGINWAEVPMYLCGVAAALVSGYLAIFALNRIAQRGKFGGFCYYCWGAGLLTLILSLIS